MVVEPHLLVLQVTEEYKALVEEIHEVDVVEAADETGQRPGMCRIGDRECAPRHVATGELRRNFHPEIGQHRMVQHDHHRHKRPQVA